VCSRHDYSTRQRSCERLRWVSWPKSGKRLVWRRAQIGNGVKHQEPPKLASLERSLILPSGLDPISCERRHSYIVADIGRPPSLSRSFSTEGNLVRLGLKTRAGFLFRDASAGLNICPTSLPKQFGYFSSQEHGCETSADFRGLQHSCRYRTVAGRGAMTLLSDSCCLLVFRVPPL
jgi:hypothetical protein